MHLRETLLRKMCPDLESTVRDSRKSVLIGAAGKLQLFGELKGTGVRIQTADSLQEHT